MRALFFLACFCMLSLSALAGCSGDSKDTKAADPAAVTQPPKDVKPKMMDGKPVGFQ